MKKMRLAFFLGFLLLFLAGTDPGRAAETEKEMATVIDDAAVLMEEEADGIKEMAADLAADTGWTVVAATCGDAGGRSSREACGEYFASYAKGSDGIICFIDTDHQKMELVAMGAAKRYFSNWRIRSILREADEGFAKEDYNQCLFLMILGAREAYAQGEQNPYAVAGAVIFALAVLAAAGFYMRRGAKGR